VSEEPKINGWWTYLKAVLFRPIWEFLTIRALFTFLFVATWWQDNFASREWKERLELTVLLPHWHPAIWLCLCLLILSFVALRHAFHLWQEQQVALAGYRAKPIPEFVIDAAKEGEEVVRFKIRNTWSQNIQAWLPYPPGEPSIESQEVQVLKIFLKCFRRPPQRECRWYSQQSFPAFRISAPMTRRLL
jgi:hypothetical protein